MVATVCGAVLVVEDEPALSRFIVMVLESAGYTVLAADDYAGAAELAATTPVVLVIADQGVQQSDEGGAAFAERLGARALFISGSFTARTPTKLPKPFLAEALLEAVEAALAD